MIKLSEYIPDQKKRQELKKLCEMFNAQYFEVFEEKKKWLFYKYNKILIKVNLGGSNGKNG